jgi:hypothetical protein
MAVSSTRDAHQRAALRVLFASAENRCVVPELAPHGQRRVYLRRYVGRDSWPVARERFDNPDHGPLYPLLYDAGSQRRVRGLNLRQAIGHIGGDGRAGERGNAGREVRDDRSIAGRVLQLDAEHGFVLRCGLRQRIGVAQRSGDARRGQHDRDGSQGDRKILRRRGARDRDCTGPVVDLH